MQANKFKTAGKAAKAFKQRPGQPAVSNSDGKGSGSSTNMLLPGVVIGIVMLIGCIVVGILMSVSSDSNETGCNNDGEGIFQTAFCLDQLCTFDTTKCEVNCPLGYKADDDDCPISCECAMTGIFNADIQFDENSVPTLLQQYFGSTVEGDSHGSFTLFSSAVLDLLTWQESWTDGRYHMPYTISDDIRNLPNHMSAIKTAMQQLSDVMECMDFVPYEADKHYEHVRIAIHKRCWSHVGRNVLVRGQDLSLGENCGGNPGTVKHELMHALGFFHEQERSDRDSYVRLISANIASEAKRNFQKQKESYVKDLSSPYDFDSILHYPSTYGSMGTHRPTMVKVDTDEPILGENRQDLSETDKTELQKLYPCINDPKEASWDEWTRWFKPLATCGLTIRKRFRSCQLYGKYATGCEGGNSDSKKVKLRDCTGKPTGEWSEWSTWSTCSVTCGQGLSGRWRKCPAYTKCGEGKPDEYRWCNTHKCLSSSGWGDWSSWSTCSASCGGGSKSVERLCYNEQNENVGGCVGTSFKNEKKYIECNSRSCDLMSGQPQEADVLPLIVVDKYNPPIYSIKPENKMFAFHRGIGLHSTDVCKDPRVIDGNVKFGDTNMDGHEDVLCSTSPTHFYIASFDPRTRSFKMSWEGKLEKCSEHKYRYLADMNGDGVSDILCISFAEMTVVIYEIDRSGKVQEMVNTNTRLCPLFDSREDHNQVFLADTDDDKITEIFCKVGNTISHYKYK